MSSFYEPQAWQLPQSVREAVWEEDNTPRQATHMPLIEPREDSAAFSSQFEEIDRAYESLARSGKTFTPYDTRRQAPHTQTTGRMGPEYGHYNSASFHGAMSDGMGMPSRPMSMDFDAQRRGGMMSRNNLSRGQDQLAQNKRQYAAQRDQNLRSYQQDHQYPRPIGANGGIEDDRLSQGTADRRDYLGRAIYGKDARAYDIDETSVHGLGLSHVPFDQERKNLRSVEPLISRADLRSPDTGLASPLSQTNTQFNLFDVASTNHHSSRTSNSSPGDGKPLNAPAPIGTRPLGSIGSTKIATPATSTPSTLGQTGDRVVSGSSAQAKDATPAAPWANSSSNVWGKGSLGVQASVWG